MQGYLIHHGVKGQRWGVRRYQNFDGSYTQAGLKRYYESEEKYNKIKEEYENSKNSDNKADITNKRLAMNKAKNRMKKDYKHLKQDKLADQGKELYSKNKRITSNEATTNALAGIGSMSLTAAAALFSTNGSLLKNYGINYDVPKQVNYILAGLGAASLLGSGINKVVSYDQNRKLRAYYSHTSNY